ncbi:MAG: DUF4261 domain-containing protein [Lachnospiraceae bacterium]|nr:DUF4261 domain-containing protein [Lachnospiraceae bacterium]
MHSKAVEIMNGWLSHENELGKKPAKIQAAGEFTYEDNQYIIVKFKPRLLDRWQVGVVGFDETGEECGHTFSEFEIYDEKTAKERCIAMIEYLKEYWKSRFLSELERIGITEEEYEQMTEEEYQAKVKEAQENNKAHRQGFLLLKEAEYDLSRLQKEIGEEFEIDMEECGKLEDGTLIFELEKNTVVISLMEFPVPEGEAEHFAEANIFWKDAVKIAKEHQAHLIVMVMSNEGEPIEAAYYFTHIVDICMHQENVSAIYTTGTVLEPSYWHKGTEMLRKGEMPISLWVYVGIIRNEKGNSGYTYGMKEFGYEDMEVIDSSKKLEDIYDFLYNVCIYVLKSDMRFRDGETVSFNSDNMLKITKSQGVYVDGDTLKIEY